MLVVVKVLLWFVLGYFGVYIGAQTDKDETWPWPLYVLCIATGPISFVVALVVWVVLLDITDLTEWPVHFWKRNK